ncbi:hypothetical protein [Orenia marismortui]|uniref:t-SNARE coiled-coil homology domain-containing protein n=1 Tax=Orenia marismortui TaxID=46469 RepID=A0A4V3GYF9_9FIRM|nr:hypothetical protein [Orenia marismortui]TDX52180.1 hypothetical protein C7959_108102 [Orenia marismortui]
MTEKEMLELLVSEVGKINNRLGGIDDRLDGMGNRLDGMDSRLDNMANDIKELKRKTANIEAQNEAIALQVNENNQILKKDNVQDWLELGSEVMRNWKKK